MENEEQVVNWAHKPRIPPIISKLQGFDICGVNCREENYTPSLGGDPMSLLSDPFFHTQALGSTFLQSGIILRFSVCCPFPQLSGFSNSELKPRLASWWTFSLNSH